MLKNINLQLLAEEQEENAEPTVETPEKKDTTEAATVDLTPEMLEKIDKIASERSQRAANSALKSYFQQQGLTEDEAKVAIEKYKAEKAKEVPEEARQQIEEANKKAREAMKIANQRLVAAEIAGLTEYNTKLLAKLVDYSTIEVSDDGTVTGVKEAAEAIAAEFPEVKRKAQAPAANPAGATQDKTAKDEYEELRAKVQKNPNDTMLVQQLFALKSKLRS